MTVGERIKVIRESKGITQHELAKKIHISPSYLCRIENNSSVVSIECVCSIADVLKITPQEILCDIFIYSENASISEKIKITVEKFPPQHQKFLLEALELFSSCLS